MKHQALQLAAQTPVTGDKLNILREYLQAFVLRSLHESEAFQALSFVGGTALRFLYGLPRFSEDLDFSIESIQNYAPEKWLAKLKRDLAFAQFDAQITWNTKTNVHNGWIKIMGLMQEAGLSGNREQKLSIKIEIDTNPPSGALTKTTLINKYFLLAVQHHDLPSLMAGKIHALNCRKYVKGRDFYDLLWYRTQRPPIEPNLALLQNAINQTEKKPWLAKNWRKNLHDKMAIIDFAAVTRDVENFLENPTEKNLLTQQHLKAIF